jgi:hypothetical protein
MNFAAGDRNVAYLIICRNVFAQLAGCGEDLRLCFLNY